MKIYNVLEIFDNGEFVTIITTSGSAIHLPMNCEHSITILDMDDPGDNYTININVDFYN